MLHYGAEAQRAFVVVLGSVSGTVEKRFGVGCGGQARIALTATDDLVHDMTIKLTDDRVGLREACRQESLVNSARMRDAIAQAKSIEGNTAMPEL